MQELRPNDATRGKMTLAIFLSILVPGAGHALARRFGWAIFWFLLCETLFFAGLQMVGNAQLDWGTPVSLGGRPVLFLLVPELGNFLATQFAGLVFTSAEAGGKHPEDFPLRELGTTLSGASGILSAFAAAHASGVMLASNEPIAAHRLAPGVRGPVHPGTAAVLSLLLPGLGHYATGRRFKALWFGGFIFGLFLIGMLLGDFADYERQRHPYYWTGQMFLGPVAWILTVALSDLRFAEVLPYQDAGLLFTTSAGMFGIIAALDAYHRAEHDWLLATRPVTPERPEAAGEGGEGDPVVTTEPAAAASAPTATSTTLDEGSVTPGPEAGS